MKHLAGTILRKSNLGDRQIYVTASTETRDRQGDIMNMSGCDLSHYRENPVVLANHDPLSPIGTAKAFVANSKLQALITFAPPGASAKADEYCALAKAGVINAVSIGFEPSDWEPLEGGGRKYTAWAPLEISIVSVPANPEALVVQRSYRGSNNRAGKSADMARLKRLEEMVALGRKGQQMVNELELSTDHIHNAPSAAHYADAVRQKMEREQLAAHAAARLSDPFVLREERLREMERLKTRGA